ncbi:MAG: ADP-ribosylglycohydrolase family protein [Alphaproteobacteria bacterium]|nr:ADP-ribosylglycohydrolase family protein [Alphaproteobacteria bacterium]
MWLLCDKKPEEILKKWGNLYKNRTYEGGKIGAFGKGFTNWLETEEAYGAKTNGCIMRLSPIVVMIDDLKVALDKAVELTSITHNHDESILATRVYIETMYMAKKGIAVPIIKNYITHKYGYDLSKSVDEIRLSYDKFYTSCKNSVPQAIVCALDADSYEDAIRNAVSLGGDSDTLACMAGGIAEVRFGVPENIKKQATKYMDNRVQNVVAEFYKKINSKSEKAIYDFHGNMFSFCGANSQNLAARNDNLWHNG